MHPLDTPLPPLDASPLDAFPDAPTWIPPHNAPLDVPPPDASPPVDVSLSPMDAPPRQKKNGQQAVSTHPTEIYSCLMKCFQRQQIQN